jgi:hypothetical protein
MPRRGAVMTTRTASTRRKEDCQRQRQSKVDAEITLFSKFGGPLTKRISLTADGSIKSDGSACLMARGEARRCEIASVAQLAGLIEQLPANQAVALGALRTGLPDQVQVVTKAKLVNGVAQPDIIARTKDNIAYREGQPAFALLDFDTKGMPDGVASKLKRLGFWGALLSVLPTLKDVARVVRRSTSAGLSRSDTGEQLPGSDGVHVYLMVRDGADIERFLRAVHDRCWFAGLGWMTVGAAGQLPSARSSTAWLAPPSGSCSRAGRSWCRRCSKTARAGVLLPSMATPWTRFQLAHRSRPSRSARSMN